MRIESFKITPQAANGRPHPSKYIANVLIRLFGWALKLYPSNFQAAFADEMLHVFAMTVRETSSTFALLIIGWREVLDLPINIMRARQKSAPLLTSPIRVWRARQVTRWSSMILSLFMLHNLISTFSNPQALYIDQLGLGLFFTLLLCISVSMLLAWRWEWLGGLLTMGSGIALGFFLIFYIGHFRPVEVSMIGLSLIGILWALPFVTFGAIFYQLSQHAVVERQLVKIQTF